MAVHEKTALVLEGGAMRGMFSAGVIDSFLDHSIDVDAVIGVSAGALFGINYLSRQRGRVIRYNKKYNSDPDYMGLRPLIKTGNIVSTEYAYERVPQKLDPFDDETFMASGKPFYAVITSLATGRPEYVRIESVFKQMDVLRASGAMPFLSRPVTIGGRQYLDGGISDSIPYKKMLDMGFKKLIVVLTRDMGYVKKPMSGAVIKAFYGKYPAFSERLARRHEFYNRAVEELRQLERYGTAFILRPNRSIEIGRMEKDPEKLQEVYDLGFEECENSIEKLLGFSNN